MANIKALKKWDHCKIAERGKHLPSKPGVYAVASGCSIFYIGKSTNLRERWLGDRHHRLPQSKGKTLRWLVCDRRSIHGIERRLIEMYDPEWNWTPVPTANAPKRLTNIFGAGLAIALITFSLSFCSSRGKIARSPKDPFELPQVVGVQPQPIQRNIATVQTPNGENLNLRDDALNVEAVLSNGQIVEVLRSEDAKGYVMVETEGGDRGWVFGKYISR